MNKKEIDIYQRNWEPNPLAGPIVLITTLDNTGNINIAPKSWITYVSVNPTLIVIGCDRRHHTAQNLLATGECVLNFPSDNIVEKVWNAHEYLVPSIDEPTMRGFTTIPSNKVKPPRIQECRAHIECQLDSVKFYGDTCILTIEAVAASIDEKAFEYNDLYSYLRPIFFLQPNKFGVIEKSIELDKVKGKDGCYQGYSNLYVILLSMLPNKVLTEGLIREHVSYLRKLDREDKLVMCGPFSDNKGGMVIIKASSLSEANSIAQSDPFVKNEVERYEVRTWELSCEANNHMGMG